MNTLRAQKQSEAAETEGSVDAHRPVQLTRRDSAAADHLISRALPDSGVAKLDVAAFTSSI